MLPVVTVYSPSRNVLLGSCVGVVLQLGCGWSCGVSQVSKGIADEVSVTLKGAAVQKQLVSAVVSVLHIDAILVTQR